MLYIGSNRPLSTVARDDQQPAFHTRDVSDYDRAIQLSFSYPHLMYAGSSEGCGCSFRYAIHIEAMVWRNSAPESPGVESGNMRRLHDYIQPLLSGNGRVGLYGCWDGDFNLAPLCDDEIDLSTLLQDDFYLKERCRYRVM